MRKLIKGRKGEALSIAVYIIATVMASLIVPPTIKTASDGTMKKNGMLIWCNMRGKGKDACRGEVGHRLFVQMPVE